MGERRRQNEVSYGYFRSNELETRIDEIVASIASKTGFKPNKLLGKSGWWGSKTIGAFHYSGMYDEKPCVLKVQGVKPETSEVFMINSFREQNNSPIIRPPLVYYWKPWNKKQGYEAFIMEDVGTRTVVKIPTTETEIEDFFRLYQEYRLNCRNKPWLEKPEEPLQKTIEQRFEKWIKASFEIYPNHPFRQEEDQKLIERAVQVLIREYQEIKPEFLHGHFSHRDLYRVGEQVVILSNLYWSWRPPFYDTIFARHWFRYDLAGKKGVSAELITKQINIWDKMINKIPTSKQERKLLDLALLERAAAGLNLDALSVKADMPCAEFIVKATRTELKELLKKFRDS